MRNQTAKKRIIHRAQPERKGKVGDQEKAKARDMLQRFEQRLSQRLHSALGEEEEDLYDDEVEDVD